MRELTVLFILLILASQCSAEIITVDDDGPADFNTIQAAIDDANDGDTIIVKPGIYLEYTSFHGKNITVTSTNPKDFEVVALTIIEYGAEFDGTEDQNCTLTGFKINFWISGNHTHATISHCLLSNSADPLGTAILSFDGTINNCVIVDNWPAGDFLGSAIRGCQGLIKNCTIAHNFEGMSVGGTTTIENCIIYHNEFQITAGGTLNILNCDVENGLEGIYSSGIVNWGLGNIDEDPCFVRIGHREYHDPDWLFFEGDYHLKSQAGRWEPNSQSWVKDDVTSSCVDAGNPMSPIGPEPFPNGGRINMGAYGGTTEASKSYFGEPVCKTIVAGDINGDCKVNFLDFRLMALHWMEDKRPCGPVPEFYYYYYEEKIYLDVSTDLVTICFDESISEEEKQTVIREDPTLESIYDEIPSYGLVLVQTKAGICESDIIQAVERLNKLSQVRYCTPVFDVGSQKLVLMDEFIVRFKPDVTAEDIAVLNEKYGVAVVRKSPYRPNRYVLRVINPKEKNALELANIYNQLQETEYGTPNVIILGGYANSYGNKYLETQ